jgi:hypothetical protein
MLINKWKGKKKGKAVPLQAWAGPQGSRRLGSQISQQSAHEGGQPYTPAAFTPQENSWYSFPLEAESTPGP